MPVVEKQSYIAHPAKSEMGIPAQLYEEHIRGVVSIYEHNATQMLRHYNGKVPNDSMLNVGRDASLFHDMGKLLEDFQRFMHNGCVGPRINHVDSGVAYLLEMFRKSDKRLREKNLPINHRLLIAAVIVQGHHIGLLNPKPDAASTVLYGSDIAKEDFLRDNRSLSASYPHIQDNSLRVMDYVNSHLNESLKIHKEVMPEGKLRPDIGDPSTNIVQLSSLSNDDNYDDMLFTALDLRLMASCVFFADHTDTARADGGVAVDEETEEFFLRAKERKNTTTR